VRSVTVTYLRCIRRTQQLSSQEGKTGKYITVRKGTRESSFLKRKKGLCEQSSLHYWLHGHTIVPLSNESYLLSNTVPSVHWFFVLCYCTWHVSDHFVLSPCCTFRWILGCLQLVDGIWSLTLIKVKKLVLSLVCMTWCNLNFHHPLAVKLRIFITLVSERTAS